MSDQITPLVQRQSEEEEEELLQTKQAAGPAPEVTPQVASAIASMRGGGQPLPAAERAYFEPRFGHDFSQVRIHRDSEAAMAAQALNAEAFTVGLDVVFGGNRYRPETGLSQRLLAHELTHVVQQNGTRLQQPKGVSGGGNAQSRRATEISEHIVPPVRTIDSVPVSVHSKCIGQTVQMQETEVSVRKVVLDLSTSRLYLITDAGNEESIPVVLSIRTADDRNKLEKVTQVAVVPNEIKLWDEEGNQVILGMPEEKAIYISSETMNENVAAARLLMTVSQKVEFALVGNLGVSFAEPSLEQENVKILDDLMTAYNSRADKDDQQLRALFTEYTAKLGNLLGLEIGYFQKLAQSHYPVGVSIENATIEDLENSLRLLEEFINDVDLRLRLKESPEDLMKKQELLLSVLPRLREFVRQAGKPEDLKGIVANVWGMNVSDYLIKVQKLDEGEIQTVLSELQQQDKDLLLNILFMGYTIKYLQKEGIGGLEGFEDLAQDYWAESLEDVLLGDCGGDQTGAAIAMRTPLTLIPGIDTAADVQDLGCNIWKIISEKDGYKDGGAWFAVVVTLLGFVPEAGSVIKGIIKAGKKGFDIVDESVVRKLVEKLATNETVNTVIDDVVSGLVRFTDERSVWTPQIIDRFNQALDLAEEGLDKMRYIVDEYNVLVDRLRELKAIAASKIEETIPKVVKEINAFIKRLFPDIVKAGARTTFVYIGEISAKLSKFKNSLTPYGRMIEYVERMEKELAAASDEAAKSASGNLEHVENALKSIDSKLDDLRVLDQTHLKTVDLTNDEIAAEFRWIDREGWVESPDPTISREANLPNTHKWREKYTGQQCRTSPTEWCPSTNQLLSREVTGRSEFNKGEGNVTVEEYTVHTEDIQHEGIRLPRYQYNCQVCTANGLKYAMTGRVVAAGTKDLTKNDVMETMAHGIVRDLNEFMKDNGSDLRYAVEKVQDKTSMQEGFYIGFTRLTSEEKEGSFVKEKAGHVILLHVDSGGKRSMIDLQMDPRQGATIPHSSEQLTQQRRAEILKEYGAVPPPGESDWEAYRVYETAEETSRKAGLESQFQGNIRNGTITAATVLAKRPVAINVDINMVRGFANLESIEIQFIDDLAKGMKQDSKDDLIYTIALGYNAGKAIVPGEKALIISIFKSLDVDNFPQELSEKRGTVRAAYNKLLKAVLDDADFGAQVTAAGKNLDDYVGLLDALGAN